MKNLLDELKLRGENSHLIFMPMSRILIEEPVSIGRFRLSPAGDIDLLDFRPMANRNLADEISQSEATGISGQALREIATSATGFSLDVLESSPILAFVAELDWDALFEATHDDDIDLLKALASIAERAMDFLRFHQCRLDLPDTLPGAVGSWQDSGAYLGAMIYNPNDCESYLIAGAAVESMAVVKGIGLDVSGIHFPQSIPIADDGEVAAVAVHGLSLLSEAMLAQSQTTKFVRVMTLFEFLANPFEYESWQKLKGDIACHCTQSKQNYLAVSERFRQLTGFRNQLGIETGYRTLIVHYGKFLNELLPRQANRNELFCELQKYCSFVLNDMLENKEMLWSEFVDYRAQLKHSMGVN